MSFGEIECFLKRVEQPSLYAYLQLSEDADASAVMGVLKARRQWAQGQQCNPRHRDEAVWLIRNLRRVLAALTQQRAAYDASLARAQRKRTIAHVAHFIETMGVSAETLPIIRCYGAGAGLDTVCIEGLIARARSVPAYSSVA